MIPSNEHTAFCFIIISQLAFSISNVLWKKPIQIIGVETTIFIRNFFTASAFGLWFLLSQKSITCSYSDFLWCVLICVVSYLGLYFFNRSNEKGDITIIVPIISLNGMVSTLLAFTLLGENVSFQRAIAMILAFAGVIVISFDFTSFSIKKLKNSTWIGFALLAMLFWGISFSFFGFANKTLGVEFFSFLLEGIIFILAGIQIFVIKKQKIFSLIGISSAILWTLALAVCGIVGVYCSNIGFYLVSISSVEYLGTIGFTFPIVMGYFYYKERISFQKWIGVGLVIMGLVVGKLS